MRDTFVATLVELAQQDKNIELLTGDLGFGVLKPYWTQLPNQFTNAGIAEQNMLSMAAGMAMEGKTVVVYSIGNFPTLRALEQIRNDCAYYNANVKIVSVGGGFVYGALGMSHHATEDIAIMRSLPNVCVICPGDKQEASAAVRRMLQTTGVCYLRLGRGSEPTIHQQPLKLELGKAVKVKYDAAASAQIAVFSTGAILEEAYAAVNLLEQQGISVAQYSFPFVKPIDRELIAACAQQYKYIFTVEEHNTIGGLGGAVAEIIAELGSKARLIRLGIADYYCTTVGDQNYLRELNGITAAEIAKKIKAVAEKDCGTET